MKFMQSIESELTAQTAVGLEYYSLGPGEGRPIFYFHGCPGGALEISWLPRQFLYETGIRLIAVNRPGFGRSEFIEQRTLTDFAHQIARLAAALNLREYGVLGFSAGGPYALACAHANPEQVRSVTLLASLAPLEEPGVLSKLHEPNRAFLEQARDDATALEAQLALQLTTGSDVLALLESVVSEPDLAVFANQRFRKHYLVALEQSIQHGARAFAQDMAIVTSAWEFKPENLATPVHLWQGTRDNNVSSGMFNYFSRNLPNVTPGLFKDSGHFFFIDRYQEILEAIAHEDVEHETS